ncbi:MAG: hypothetical protein GY869_22705, partial [Planctomycetes bacterium]|nr:hypothetical protein [Planctomycetota bacterium]
LEAKQTDQAVQQRNAELLQKMVAEMKTDSPNLSQGTGMTAGYNNGFFIKTVDDQFLLKMNGMLQFRHSFLHTDDGSSVLDAEGFKVGDPYGIDPSANGFELTRPRLKFSGHMLGNVKYMVQMEFADDNNNYGALLDYMVYYSFTPELGIKVGQFKVPFSREYNIAATKLMLADRGYANAVYEAGRSTGVELFGAFDCGDTKMHYRAGVFNGLRDAGNRPIHDNDNNPTVAARVVMPLMGATPADFAMESDLAYHENAVIQLGAGMAYANNRTEDHLAGGVQDNYVVLGKGGDCLSNGIELGGELTMFTADIAYKHQGLSLILDGYYQDSDLDSAEAAFEHDFGSSRDAFGIEGDSMQNWGWNFQAGYFLVPKEFELVSRVGGICVDGTNDALEFAGGWNWYLSGQNVRIAMDVTYIDDLMVTNSGANLHGIQNNALLLIRTQLQFTF